MAQKFKELFEKLITLNVNDKVEKRDGGKDASGNTLRLSYLSWSYAWAEFCKAVLELGFSMPTYKVHRDTNGLPYFNSEETGAMVFTEVTVDNVTHSMWLPVMDTKNNAMKTKPYSYQTKYGEKTVQPYTMFDINKTIMRCLVKNLAMYGEGLYLFSGEDLPPLSSDSDGVVQSKPTQPREVAPQDFSATNPNEPIRKTTVMLLNSLNEKLSVEDRAKVQAFLIKYNASSFEQLTQQQGHALVVNLTQKVTK